MSCESYLDTINETTVTNIKWMHHKDKYDSFKNCLAGVSKHKSSHYKLGREEDKNFCSCNFHQKKPHNEDDNNYNP